MRLMSSLLALVCVACAPQVVRGPQSCEEAVVDGFDRTQRGTTYNTYGAGYRIGLHQSGRDVTLMTSWATEGSAQFDIPAGTTLDLAFDNGATMQLVTSQPASPVVDMNRIYAVTMSTRWNVQTRLGPDELAILADVGISAARIRVQGIEMTMTLTAPTQAGMQTLAICYAGGF